MTDKVKSATKKAPAKKAEVATVDQEALDAQLMRMVGHKSTSEIAKELGMAPHEVRVRINEMFDNIDILTIQQQRSKLLITLNRIVDQASQRIDSIGGQVDDREYAAILNASTSAINVHLRELARLEKADTTQIETLNNLRVQELLRLMDAVVTSSVEELVETHDTVDYEEVMALFRDKLREEAAKIDLA